MKIMLFCILIIFSIFTLVQADSLILRQVYKFDNDWRIGVLEGAANDVRYISSLGLWKGHESEYIIVKKFDDYIDSHIISAINIDAINVILVSHGKGLLAVSYPDGKIRKLNIPDNRRSGPLKLHWSNGFVFAFYARGDSEYEIYVYRRMNNGVFDANYSLGEKGDIFSGFNVIGNIDREGMIKYVDVISTERVEVELHATEPSDRDDR